MTSRARCAAALVLVALSATAAWAEHLDLTLSFDERELRAEKLGDYDFVTLPGCEITREPGRPQLPALPVTMALPPGARVSGVEVLTAESTELLGRYTPRPAQRPRILPVPGLDLPRPAAVPPDPEVYGSRSPYPPSIAELTSQGHMGGEHLVSVVVYPVQFLPSVGRLRFFRSVTLRVSYETEDARARAEADHPSIIAPLVVKNRPPVIGAPGPIAPEFRLTPGDYEHVIIVGDSSFEPSFAPLAAWKTRKGVPSTIVPVTWIDAHYPGADGAERVRNFIADAHATWGAAWFLLAGDTDWVPARRAYAMTSEANGHPDEDQIGCDLYFSDLDGTWDADADGTYGELADGVDLYPDVYVGRAPVRTVEDADAFVAKLIDYERHPLDDFELNMLMAAEVLWTDPFTDSGEALNRIDREYVPPRFNPITKLYETMGNESGESVLSALNAGQGHFLHSGHAWYTVMGCGDGAIYRWDVAALTNSRRQPLVYSIGCWPAAFDLDEDCIAERFLQNPEGGGVAFIGNSRYGWASPGNPGYGYSERFMQEFYRVLFVECETRVGAALSAAKTAFIPFSQAENVYRWHQYEINLLGDPEMPVWTARPNALQVAVPDSVFPGPSVLEVGVRTSAGPLEDALVCVTNGQDVYERVRTSADGTAVLSIDTVLPDSLDITVTAENCMPFEAAVPVVFNGPYLRAVASAVDDASGGNGDGLAGPGESVELSLTLRNFGTADAPGVHVELSSADPAVEVLDGSRDFGDVPAGGTSVGASPFLVAVSPDVGDRHVAVLDVAMTSPGSRTVWSGTASFTVAAPALAATSYSIDDSRLGDGNGFAEPGEELDVMVEVKNTGLAAAGSVSFLLYTEDPHIEITSGAAELPGLDAGGVGKAVFGLRVASGCPVPAFPLLMLDATTSSGSSFCDSLRITVGSAGFAHDFESGPSGWTHGGPLDIWGLATTRSHSGSVSWYAGDPVAHEYPDNADARLDSPEFVRGEGAELRFWCWYELPIYHQDGFYVEVLSHGAPFDTLDFIGSGGALDFLGSIGNDWIEYSYRLPGSVGDTLQVRFRFTSDGSDAAEGVYVDDVSITATGAPDGTGVPEPPGEAAVKMSLHQNRPNPFNPTTSISFTMHEGGEVQLSVYNVQGRLIRRLSAGFMRPGTYEVAWDGKDELGADVAAGVYLYRLSVGEQEETRKMILVR